MSSVNCNYFSIQFGGSSDKAVKIVIALSQFLYTGGPDSFSSSAFEPTLVREISPQDFLYRDSIPFTSDENEGSLTCGDCGIKFFSCTRTSGKDRIMKHMEYVHTLGKHGEVHLLYSLSQLSELRMI